MTDKIKNDVLYKRNYLLTSREILLAGRNYSSIKFINIYIEYIDILLGYNHTIKRDSNLHHYIATASNDNYLFIINIIYNFLYTIKRVLVILNTNELQILTYAIQ